MKLPIIITLGCLLTACVSGQTPGHAQSSQTKPAQPRTFALAMQKILTSPTKTNWLGVCFMINHPQVLMQRGLMRSSVAIYQQSNTW